MENKKPKHFLIFKIIGFTTLIGVIAGIVLTITGFSNFENNNFMIGAFLFTISSFLSILFLTLGFRPEIQKLAIKSTKYIQNENKDDMKDISTNNAEISKVAIKTTATAIKDGLKDAKFCKECGKEIDADAKFCSFCGKKQ